MAAARHASVSKLMLLCQRHPRRLIPGMLTLLACLPETVAADSYSHLLTLVSCLLLSASCSVGVTVRATCLLPDRRVGAFDAVSTPRSPQSLQHLFAGLLAPHLPHMYGASSVSACCSFLRVNNTGHAMKPFSNWMPSSSCDVQVSGFDTCAESALQKREADWAEGEAMAALALSLGYPTAACATEHLASTQSYCIPPTSQQVVSSVHIILLHC